MTRDETARLVAICLATWTTHPVANVDALVTAWELALGDVPYPAAEAALGTYLREGRFFPAPTEIRALVLDATGAFPSGGDAWRMVLRRIRGTYPGQPAPPWEVPPAVKETVDQMGGIHALRMSEHPGADEARFLKLYEQNRLQTAREADVAAVLEGARVPALAGAGS